MDACISLDWFKCPRVFPRAVATASNAWHKLDSIYDRCQRRERARFASFGGAEQWGDGSGWIDWIVS